MRTIDYRLKICLVAVNSAWYQSNLALYYLRQMVADLHFKCVIREFTTQDLPLEVLRGIVKEKPDVVCFSAYIWNRAYLENLIPQVKLLLPEKRIVIGGPEAAIGDYGLGKYDFIIEGEGEKSFRDLAETEFEGRGSILTGKPLLLKDIPFPYLPPDRKTLKGKLVYYECSRGCPFSCVYCLSAEDKRNEVRFDVDSPLQRSRLYDELEALISLEPKTVKFVDRSFNAHPRLARVIWDYVISRAPDCEFHFEIYPGLLTEEDISLLQTAPAGLIRFEVGIQSVSPNVNKACHRNSDWQRSKQLLAALRQRTKLILHTDLIAGLPGERYDSILHSIDELASVLPHEIQLGMLKILPHTPMQRLASELEYKWQAKPPYQVLSSDRLSFNQLCRLQDLARVLNLYWNKGEFASQWTELLKQHKSTEILLALLKHHRIHDLPLHSLAKGKRERVFIAVVAKL